MKLISVMSRSQKETLRLAAHISSLLKEGDILCLSGQLGSGKTTFVKGLARGLGVKSTEVNSPSFVLLNIYEGNFPLYHFDLYRIDDMKEMFNLGYEEFFYGHGITVVEWAEKLGELFPKECLNIQLSHQGDAQRLLVFQAFGKRYEEILRHNISH